jgi:tRNA(Glu) U13 pseudouridine synthase TruD
MQWMNYYLVKKNLSELPEIFQTISHKIKMEDYEEEILGRVLKREGLELSQFNIRQSGNYFKSNEREVLVYPEEFKLTGPTKDGDLYVAVVEFTLVSGSYATIVLKQVFGQ